MTAPINRTDSADSAAQHPELQLARRWAQEVLGLEASDDPQAQRAAALRRLADDDFVLWPQGHVAILLLTGGGLTDEEQYTLDEGVGFQLRGAVEEFSKQFFEIAPAGRRSRWEQLHAACEGYPVLQRQIASLESGLDVEPQAGEPTDALARELIDVICRTFVAWPTESSRRRRAAIRRFFAEPQQWSQAAETLRRTRPDIAGLMPNFLSRIHQLPWRANRMQVGRSKRLKLQQAQPVPATSAETPEGQSDWWRALLLGPAIVALLRACVSMTSHPEPPPPRNFSVDEIRGLQESLQRLGLERQGDGSVQVAPSDRLFGQQFRLERQEDGSYQLVPRDNPQNAPDADDPNDIWSTPDYRIMPPKPQQPEVPSYRLPPPADPNRSLSPFLQPELRPGGNDLPTSPPTGEGESGR